MPRKKKEENTLITPQIPEEIVFNNIKSTITKARNNIAKVINSEMVKTYWEIGAYIYNAQNGQERANYGSYLIKYLADKLTREFGKGFNKTNLWRMRQFYEIFSIIYKLRQQSFLDNQDFRESKKEDYVKVRQQSFRDNQDSRVSKNENSIKACSQSSTENQPPKCPKELLKLSWTHIRTIMTLDTEAEIIFYIKECSEGNWSTRQLNRQIESQYYQRLMHTQQKKEDEVIELNILTAFDIIKDPYVLEFLDMKEDKKYLEKDLENKIIDNLQNFLLELGKGFAFMGRQYRFSIEDKHYYIDLVFYNVILKCYVLIDLKKGELDYSDVGQMDFYVRYFEQEVKRSDDNPTIGLILCSKKSKAMVKYTMLNDGKQVFASKYNLYLPTEEELINYINKESELLELEEEIDKDNNNNE